MGNQTFRSSVLTIVSASLSAGLGSPPGSDFTHQSHGLATVNLQRDLFDGMDNAVGTLKKTLVVEVQIGWQYI